MKKTQKTVLSNQQEYFVGICENKYCCYCHNKTFCLLNKILIISKISSLSFFLCSIQNCLILKFECFTYLLSKFQSVKFPLIKSKICLSTDSSVKKYFARLNQVIYTEISSEIWLIHSSLFFSYLKQSNFTDNQQIFTDSDSKSKVIPICDFQPIISKI